MCIIALIPSGKQITKQTLKTCWENNTHGGGFCYTNGKSVETHKEMSSFKRFYNDFVYARQNFPQSTFIVHFRISTHGKINEDNCHPFKVNNKIAFAHNGIIHNSTKSEHYSDTVMFNEEVLKTLPSYFLFNPTMHKLIQAYIGSGSKLAFLTHDNKHIIINEQAGVWDDGVWFSNQGYQRSKYLDYGGTNVGWNNFYGNTYNKVKSTQVPSKLPSPSKAPSKLPSKAPSITQEWYKPTQQEIGFGSGRAYKDVDYANDFNYQPYVPNQNGKRFTGNFKGIGKVSNQEEVFDMGCSMCGKHLASTIERNNDLCFGCDDMYSGDFSV